MPLHPFARMLYRDFIQIGASHPTMSLDEIRNAVRIEFYRRGGSNDPELIARGLAYGRKHLRHLKNAVSTYNSSRGGAQVAEWKALNDESARLALTSFDDKVRYTPRRSLITNYRESLPPQLRTARLTAYDNEKLNLIGEATPTLPAPSFSSTTLNRDEVEISSVTIRKNGRKGTFEPDNISAFGMDVVSENSINEDDDEDEEADEDEGEREEEEEGRDTRVFS